MGLGNTTLITKDGVSVAKEVFLDDPFENQGAQLVKAVAIKTNEDAGDGTSTATLLTHAIVKEGMKVVAKGVNPVGIKKGIDKATELVVKELKESSRPIEGMKKMVQVATISANGDKEMGEEIASALEKVGKDGIVTTGLSSTFETITEFVEGMAFNKGYISPYFAKKTEDNIVTMEHPVIIMTDGKISSYLDIAPVLEKIITTEEAKGRPVFIIADDIDSDALNYLTVNHLKGALDICAVKAPGFGASRQYQLEDLSVLVDGEVVSTKKGDMIKDTVIDMTGSCRRIVVTKDKTTIIDGDGLKEDIDLQMEKIKAQIEETEIDFDKKKHQERLARFSSGVAIIKVGGTSEVEQGEKKDRVDDALSATKAGIEEGIISGGGTALAQISKRLAKTKLIGYTKEEKLGFHILLKAIEEPVKRIASNASGINGKVILKSVQKAPLGVGYDVFKGEFVNMIASGIIDPTKVTRTALQNASSVAGLLLTTECIIVDIPEEQPASNGMGM
jgi:chaperonin GroEL